MSWILSKEEWIDVSPTMKSTNGFPGFLFPFFSPSAQMEKNKSITWAAGSLLLFFSLLPCRWPFCQHALPLCCRYSKQFIKWNAKPDICCFFGRLFVVGYPLKSGTRRLLFTWLPSGAWKLLLFLLSHLSHLVDVSIWFFFSILRRFGATQGFDI